MALQRKRIPIVVPRRKEFGEHINNHQVEFCKTIEERLGTIIVIENINELAEKIQNYDTIVPVPISEKRLKARGYNQSLLIAREIANQLNLELLNNCLIKTKNIVEQSKLNRDDRIQNVKGVYDIKNKQLIKNKKILLIDDIYTTGSTVNECSKILRQGSPTEIGVLVLAKD